MTIPLISVIIPTHKRSIYLQRCLSSINIQYNREIIQIIVISDIADKTTDTICSLNLNNGDIYVVKDGAIGPAESRNIGLKLSDGLFIMFLDDDDAWDQRFMQSFHNILREKMILVAYFNCKVIKESRFESGPERKGEQILDLAGALNSEVFVKNQVHMSCFIFQKSLINNLQFETSMRAYEDWEFLLSVFERKMPVHIPLICSEVYEVDDITTDRRGQSDQATNMHALFDYIYVYRKHKSINDDIRLKRKNLIGIAGIDLPEFLL